MPPTRKPRSRNGLRSLNERELRFCACYLRLTNGTKAAIEAGYSARSAYNQASRLMKKDEVLAEIARLRAGRDKLTVLNTAYVIENLLRIADGEGKRSSSRTRVRALELLGKHLGMFRGKSNGEVSGGGGAPVRVHVYIPDNGRDNLPAGSDPQPDPPATT
jgi:phage terminase small subunit